MTNGPNWNHQWLGVLHKTLDDGRLISTRGANVRERDHVTVALNMNYPVLTVPERRLNYRFMAAEAWWILKGSDRVDELVPYNRRMAEFSDDGDTLAGAYGIRFADQIEQVVTKLEEELNTRQATLTLWTPNPPKTRDVPCTVALDFKIRDGRLNCHAFMRSSDVWLGLPYDAFSFTAMALRVIERLNYRKEDKKETLIPGTLYVTAASSHLYEQHFDSALSLLNIEGWPIGPKTPVPARLYDPASRVGDHPDADLTYRLGLLKDTSRGDPARWWEDTT